MGCGSADWVGHGFGLDSIQILVGIRLGFGSDSVWIRFGFDLAFNLGFGLACLGLDLISACAAWDSVWNSVSHVADSVWASIAWLGDSACD